MTTIGIIGSGHVGSNLARAAIAHGYDVVLSNSQGPDTLAGLVQDLGPKARAAMPEEAASFLRDAEEDVAIRKPVPAASRRADTCCRACRA